LRAAARLYATGGNAAIYYGLGVTEHSQGSTMVMGMANLAMATGNIGKGRRRRQARCAARTTCRAPATWARSRTNFSGYRHVSDDAVRHVRRSLGCAAQGDPGLRIPNMIDAAIEGRSRASTSRARTSPSPIPTPST
jgi:formate dehydrogenase major subunit